jgi:hypothetical protein
MEIKVPQTLSYSPLFHRASSKVSDQLESRMTFVRNQSSKYALPPNLAKSLAQEDPFILSVTVLYFIGFCGVPVRRAGFDVQFHKTGDSSAAPYKYIPKRRLEAWLLAAWQAINTTCAKIRKNPRRLCGEWISYDHSIV